MKNLGKSSADHALLIRIVPSRGLTTLFNHRQQSGWQDGIEVG
jgi:hypothetical protein